MTNILSSKWVLDGERTCPKITIRGLHYKKPYGVIEINYDNTKANTITQVLIPFGRYTRGMTDKAHSDSWEVLKIQHAHKYDVEWDLCEQNGQKHLLSFKYFPTLEMIDSVWNKIVEMKATFLTVKDDIVVFRLENGSYVTFSSLFVNPYLS